MIGNDLVFSAAQRCEYRLAVYIYAVNYIPVIVTSPHCNELISKYQVVLLLVWLCTPICPTLVAFTVAEGET